MDRNSMIEFMKSIMKSDPYLALDLPHALSMSKNTILAKPGRNSICEYLSQVQALFLFSIDHDSPAYFRIIPGSIYSVASLKIFIEESVIKRIVHLADTGFYSSININLDSMKIFYIIPL